ncbi:MAG: energy-coupling factor ABC transporter permease [Sedimentibacter sp.]|uniref:energy-coupling factor ABC transporter permease n=1 Tax=Sedimentibacter sp. TaxID=1960295 RepID=UPI00315979BE
MHMADALISAATGGVMWAASAGTASYSVRKVQTGLDESENKIPLMGVTGAFVFAAQMINFTIPGTGSSGHIGGGLLLAVMLGPHAGFLTMISILAIQALFFADGGLLALGCNIFNMGFFTCFVAYPLVYRKITRGRLSKKTILAGSVLAAVVGLQLGSLAVVLETVLSGKTELPFSTFLLMMQPIHLAIGVIEGLVTASALTFLWNARPELLEIDGSRKEIINSSNKRIIAFILCAALIVGGAVSWYASDNPDGLEWSIEKTIGSSEVEGSSIIHEFFGNIQDRISFLPDYSFKSDAKTQTPENLGTSVSGIAGSILTLALAAMVGAVSKKHRRNNKKIKE